MLTALELLECAVIVLLDFLLLGQGGDSGLGMPLFDLTALTSGSLPVALLFAMDCFIGIEASTIYGEAAKDPKTTIPRAIYLSIILIGAFFLITSWLMIVASGVDKAVPAIAGLPDPTAYVFEVAGRYSGDGALPTIMGLLFVTSIYAAVSAFHNYIARHTCCWLHASSHATPHIVHSWAQITRNQRRHEKSKDGLCGRSSHDITSNSAAQKSQAFRSPQHIGATSYSIY